MKKRSTETRQAAAKASGLGGEVVGLNLGDRTSDLCALGEDGAIVEEGRVQTTQAGMTRWFEGRKRMRVVMEVGTHSPWVSRLLTDLGHEVLVANPRKLRFIYQNRKKGDKVDARSLARVGRLDPELLSPVTHRPEDGAGPCGSEDAGRAGRARVQLVNHARGAAKATGSRLRKCPTRRFVEKTGNSFRRA